MQIIMTKIAIYKDFGKQLYMFLKSFCLSTSCRAIISKRPTTIHRGVHRFHNFIPMKKTPIAIEGFKM